MKNKKIIAVVGIAIMCLNIGITVFAAYFNDLPESHWAYANIMRLADEDVINGYPDGSYQPGKAVTRAEFIKLIIAAAVNEQEANSLAYSPYKDFGWYVPYVMYANSGKLLPDNDDDFVKKGNANKEINRLDMAQILAKVCYFKHMINQKEALNADDPNFSDIVGLNEAYIDQIRRVAKAGLITGYPDGTFGPDRTMTRAECATIIARFMDKKGVK